MDNERMQLKDFLDVLNRRRKIVYRVVVVAVVLAVIYNCLASPVYEASVSFRVSPRGANEAVGTMSGGLYTEDQMLKLLTTAEIVKSRSVMEATINKIAADVPPENRPSPEWLQKQISVTPTKNTTVFSVGVRAYSPQDAQMIANTLAREFLNKMAELARSEGKDARVFIGERLAEAKRNLDAVERDMIAYKKDKKTISVSDQTKVYVERQGILKKLDVENQLAINSAAARLSDMNSQISRQNPGFVADSPLIQQYKSRLADQEGELIIARSNYSDVHPRVVSLKASVAETRAKLNAEIARVVKAEAPSSNPVHLNMLQMRIQAEAELASAQAQQRALRGAEAQSEADIKVIPDREQGLARLLRDYTVAEESYTMLAKRYDQARIDEVMQPSNVQIVDTANLPKKPIRPRSVLNVIIALVFGFFFGVMGAFAVDYFRKTIDNAADVKRYLGIPVIGGVPNLELYNPKRKLSWVDKLLIRVGMKAKEVRCG